MRRFAANLGVAFSVAAVAAGIGADACADAALDEPLALGNEQPLALIASLPTARSGAVLALGESSWRAGLDVANNFVHEYNASEVLALDGESQRYQLGVRYGVAERWEVGMSVPWIRYSDGILDNFIEDFHKFWGLSDGGRPDYPTRQLQFSYRRDGVAELDFRRAESGIGDMQFSAAYQLEQTARTDMAVVMTLTAPTGSADELTGNGSGNIGVALAATQRQLFDSPLTGIGNIGVLWLPPGDVLGALQKNVVWFASGGVGWAATQNLRLKAQLDVNSALYDSGLTALGSDAIRLSLGGSLRLTRQWVLDAAVGEDARVDTAPDVTFHLALRARYY